jgi:hypothetical protein
MRGVRSAGPSLTGEHWRPSDSNRSLSTSNQSPSPHAKSGGKKFGEARDRGGIFGDTLRFPGDRDRAIPRLRLQSRRKSKTIPTVPGNRNCAGLRGGAGRTQTCNQVIMSPELPSTAVVGRLPGDLAGRIALPSIWHRLRKRRHGGIGTTGGKAPLLPGRMEKRAVRSVALATTRS